MSIDVMMWALRQAPVTDTTQALVLVALADRAWEDGTRAYPSIATLANAARCSERTVQRKLRELEELGVIRESAHVPNTRADRRPICYDLAMPGTDAAVAARGDNDGTDAAAGRQDALDGVTPVSPDPSLPDPTQPKRERRAPETSMPDPWVITRDMRAWAVYAAPGVDLDAATAQFVDHAIANDRRQRDWPASWRLWIRRTKPSRGPAPSAQLALDGRGNGPSLQPTVAAGLALAQKYRDAEQ